MRPVYAANILYNVNFRRESRQGSRQSCYQLILYRNSTSQYNVGRFDNPYSRSGVWQWRGRLKAIL